MKSKIWNWLLSTLFIVMTLWILIFHMQDVRANLEASFIWAVPAFVISHTALHRKITKVHDSLLTKENTNDGTGN